MPATEQITEQVTDRKADRFLSGVRPFAASPVRLAVWSLALLAVALRLWAAQGELWLDEIWSLDLVAPLHSPLEALWRVSHDNNHFINSMWMALLGQDASALAYRALSICIGGLTVLAAARIGFQHSQAAGLACALLAATLTPLVAHGSEARGYSGLILLTLIGFDAWLRAVQPGAAAKWKWILGAAVCIGSCFHLTAVAIAATAGLATVLMWLPSMGAKKAIASAAELFRPCVYALLPVVAATAAGIATVGTYTVGGIDPFTIANFFKGYGGMLASVAGVPAASGGWQAAAIALAVFAVLAVFRAIGREMTALGIAALIAMPVAMAALRMPNLENPRYFLVPGVAAILVLSAAFGRVWQQGGVARAAGVAALAAIVAVNLWSLALFASAGRGLKTPVAQAMAASGKTAFTADNGFRVPSTLKYLSRRAGLKLTFVKTADACRQPPDWFVVEGDIARAPVPVAFERSFGDCKFRFARLDGFDHAATGGWILFRRK
ncbi:MAG: hypothetical protein AB7F96_07575 [Beijerinckiaceae bacterium]